MLDTFPTKIEHLDVALEIEKRYEPGAIVENTFSGIKGGVKVMKNSHNDFQTEKYNQNS